MSLRLKTTRSPHPNWRHEYGYVTVAFNEVSACLLEHCALDVETAFARAKVVAWRHCAIRVLTAATSQDVETVEHVESVLAIVPRPA